MRALILMAILTAPVAAQHDSHLSGLVLDPSERPVPGAQVSVVHEDTGIRRAVSTHGNGDYFIPSLRPGLYKVTVRKEGFSTLVRFGLKIDTARTARVDFTLSLGSIVETMTVEDQHVSMNTSDASTGTLVGRSEMERLPLTGRGLLSLLEMAPGTVTVPATRGDAGQFTANGQRPNSHYFSVDGVSVNTGLIAGGQPAQPAAGALPAVTAFGGYHSLASTEALDEFRVLTSTTTPEFGRLAGAQVSMGTRSGSNDIHGSLFGYHRNEKLDANDWFANRHGLHRSPLNMNDYGGSLGGPVRRDRTFFFLAAERFTLRQPAIWRGVVPSAATRENAPSWSEPLLKLFPEPTGRALTPQLSEWIGQTSRPSDMNSQSLRFDHAFSPGVTFFARYGRAPSRTEFGGMQQINSLAVNFTTFTAGLNARITSRLSNDFRFGAAHTAAGSYWRQAGAEGESVCHFAELLSAASRNPNVDCTAFLRLSIGGVGQLVSGRENGHRQRQWNLVETVSLSLPSHDLRVGGDYRRLIPERRQPVNNFTIMADNLNDLLNRQFLWISASAVEPNKVFLDELSLFVQDTWRLHPRLTLTYGVRWEWSPPPVLATPLTGQQQGFSPFNPQVTPAAWASRLNNVAPRMGAAWMLAKDKPTVLRFGFGRYYDSSLAVAADLLNGSPFQLWQLASPAPEVSGPARSIVTHGFAPGLRLPRVWQWNVALERAIAKGNTLSVGYSGSQGLDLLRREVGGPAQANVTRLALVTNNGSSIYHGLQANWRMRLGPARASAAYSWSHSIDTTSTDSLLHWAGPGLAPVDDRGSSDFDFRHALNLTFGATSPGRSRLTRSWNLDGIFRARTGFPVSVLQAENAMGVVLANAFRPTIVPGASVWAADPNAPRGRRLNAAAFRSGGLEQGALGRNSIPGFGMWQTDLALTREFALSSRNRLQVRLESFNALNHANLADPVRFLASPLFGEPASMLNVMLGTGTAGSGLSPMLQSGGARSFQMAVRWRF